LFVDLPLAELRDYRPDVYEPPDFDEFWTREIGDARSHDVNAQFTPAETAIRHAQVFDVTFAGHGGDPIKAWLLIPLAGAPNETVIVEYTGYGGGRGNPLDWLTWSSAGYPHLIMDTRGQGGAWRSAETSDLGDGGQPSSPGFLTRGISDPRGYYYTRLFVDAAGPSTRPGVTPTLPACASSRQASAKGRSCARCCTPGRRRVCDVARRPIPRASASSREITRACPMPNLRSTASPPRRDRTGIPHGLVHRRREPRETLRCPALFSVGLLDEVTPASTVFAAFNHYAGPKEIAVYSFNGHEGGGTTHLLKQLDFLATGTKGQREFAPLPRLQAGDYG